MAKPIRIQCPAAVYHVMARGSHGQEILRDDRDRQRFRETLGETCEKTALGIHACALVGNRCFHRSTAVPLRRVSERLAMGHYTRVTQAMSRMNRRSGRRLQVLRRKLEGLPTGGELSSGLVVIFPGPLNDAGNPNSVSSLFPGQPGHGSRIIQCCPAPSNFCPLRFPNYFPHIPRHGRRFLVSFKHDGIQCGGK